MDHSELGKDICASGSVLRGLCACALLTVLPACGLVFGATVPTSDSGGEGGSETSTSATSGVTTGSAGTGNAAASGSGSGEGGQTDTGGVNSPALDLCRGHFGVPLVDDTSDGWTTVDDEGEFVYVTGAYLRDVQLGSGCVSPSSNIEVYVAKLGILDGKCDYVWHQGDYEAKPAKSCVVVVNKFGVLSGLQPDIPGTVFVEVYAPYGSSMLCAALPLDSSQHYKIIGLNSEDGVCIPKLFQQSDTACQIGPPLGAIDPANDYDVDLKGP